jgi:hypothetical protein
MVDDSKDAARRRRRRRWIVLCSLPGYLALVAFALMAWGQSWQLDPPEPLLVVILPFLVLGVLSWGLAPFVTVLDLVLLLRDPWRRERPRRERIGLRLLVLGSPVAWFLSNGILDAYHLLR